MNEHRRQILEMLANGRITADEAEHLLSALGKEAPPGSGASAFDPKPKPKPKYLRILVQSIEKKDGEAGSPTNINVRVPMQLLRAGIRLTNFIPAQARERVNNAMKDRGMDFDLNQVKPENLEEMIDQLNDLQVDVEHTDRGNDVKVRVFCE